MDHFEDQFLTESHEPLGISFEEEAKFFDPEAAQEADFLHPQQQVEESIYTDDPVRVYLREMGAVPLLTREGEQPACPSETRKEEAAMPNLAEILGLGAQRNAQHRTEELD